MSDACADTAHTRPTREVNSDVRILNFRSDVTYVPLRKTNDVRRESLYAAQNVKNELTNDFYCDR